MPLISIVVTAFNRAWCLPRAIASCLAQTDQNFEIVVVNDGSTDETEEVMQHLQTLDSRIRCVRMHQNRGMFQAMSCGVHAATGSLITFLDSDDELLPEALAVFRKYMASERTPPVLLCRLRTDDGRILGNLPVHSAMRVFSYYELLREFAIGDYLGCVPRRMLLEGQFFACVEYVKFYTHNLWTPLFRDAGHVALCPDVVGLVHLGHVDRRTKSLARNAIGWATGVQYFISHFGDDLIRARGRVYRPLTTLMICYWHLNRYRDAAMAALKGALYRARHLTWHWRWGR